MTDEQDRPWRSEFHLSKSYRELGRSSELARLRRLGQVIPVVRGAHRSVESIPTDPDRAADDAVLAKIRATQLVAREPLVFLSHAAAAIWELPMVMSRHQRIVVSSRPDTGGRSNAHVTRTSVGYPPPSRYRGGLEVSSLARTVIDLARVAQFTTAVTAADAALRGQEAGWGRSMRMAVARQELEVELAHVAGSRGSALCSGVIDFADGASGSAGESISRCGMRLFGVSPPRLQVPFHDHEGLIGIVDFYWPEFDVIGEFDGHGKYLRDEFTRGRSAGLVVVEEKVREDRLRAMGHRMVRWGWAEATKPSTMVAALRHAGVR